jgi:hypothetical protein
LTFSEQRIPTIPTTHISWRLPKQLGKKKNKKNAVYEKKQNLTNKYDFFHFTWEKRTKKREDTSMNTTCGDFKTKYKGIEKEFGTESLRHSNRLLTATSIWCKMQYTATSVNALDEHIEASTSGSS